MAAQIYLNNILIDPKEVTGAERISVTITDESEDGNNAKSISGDLEFTGSAYEIFKNEILTKVDGNLKTVDIIIKDDCCKDVEIFNGEIKGSDADWCEGECKVKVKPVQKAREFDCIRSTVITESSRLKFNNSPTNFISQAYPRVVYCNDPRPDLIQFFIMLFGAIFYLLLIILTPVVIVISAIIRVVCKVLEVLDNAGFLVPTCPPGLKDGIFDDYKEFIKYIDDKIVGCGRKHPSPLVRDYLNNLCTICGATLQSSIWNDPGSPYYNTILVNAPARKGTYDDSITIIEENLLTLNGAEVLDIITQPINGKWKLRNKVLIIERKDFFESGVLWLDFSSIDPKRILEQCYEFSGDPIPAYGKFEYQEDAQDRAGSEARKYYNDIVEWNPFANPVQIGEALVQLPFSPSRFRQDGIDEDVLDFPLWELPILPYRSEIKKSKGSLFLSNGTMTNPKLLIWDEQDLNEAKIKRYSGVGGTNGYNYPFVFEEIAGESPAQYSAGKLQMTVQKNLFHNFFHINDPRLGTFKTRNYRIKFQYDCEDLRTFELSKLVKMKFFDSVREGTIGQIAIDFEDRTINVIGKI